MKILNFGSCNIDFVYSLNHIALAGETETSNALNVFPGGKGLNQSIAASRAGAYVYHAGCIGTDGEMLSSLLKDNGVDTTYLKYVEERNGHAVIQVGDDGENCIFIYPGSNNMITEDFIDEVLGNFGKGDIIVLQNEINMVDIIVKKAYEKQMYIVLNPSPCNEAIKKIDLKLVSMLLLNETEAEAFSSSSDPELALEFFRNNFPEMKVVLTLGKKGCVYQDKQSAIRRPAFCVKAVDTTAAGDTFTGYFLAKIADGTPCEGALKIASAAAAISVSRNGAAPSIPSIDEVLARIDELPEYKRDGDLTAVRQKIDEYIKRNLKNTAPKGLAECLGYSVTHTQSLVKKIYDEPISKLVQDECCRQAAKLLKETDLPVGEIIRRLGYENESFLRNIFKKKYGKSFLEYRNSEGE